METELKTTESTMMQSEKQVLIDAQSESIEAAVNGSTAIPQAGRLCGIITLVVYYVHVYMI